MTTNGLKYGYNLSTQTKISHDLIELPSQEQSYWLHFDYKDPDSKQWLRNHSGLAPVVIDALLNDETRPRATLIDDGILLSLRGVNLSPQSTPDDMVSIRIWLQGNKVISSYRRNLMSVADIASDLDNKRGPDDCAALIVTLIGNLMSRMANTIIDMEDKVDQLEEEILTSQPKNLTADLADLRRQLIALRRYLAPQREALLMLQSEKFTAFSSADKIMIRESLDHLSRYIEELDSTRERATVAQEELNNRLTDQLNHRMYVLSIISAIFLPLGFFTGLLGINVGGIPGADNQQAFYLFIIFLVLIVGAQWGLLKKYRWF